jgi:hypothetical protein
MYFQLIPVNFGFLQGPDREHTSRDTVHHMLARKITRIYVKMYTAMWSDRLLKESDNPSKRENQ